MSHTLAPTAHRVPATAPQLSFITALLRDRDVPADLAQVTRAALDAAPGTLTKAAASRLITTLKACRYAPRTQPAAPVAVAPVADDFAGVEGPADRPVPVPAAAPAITPTKGDVLLSAATNTVIRVRQSQQGNLYALTRPATAHADDLPPFTYAPGLLRNLPADTRRLTLTEATAISAAWGECFRCGRTLTAAASITKGIGPVCITYVTG